MTAKAHARASEIGGETYGENEAGGTQVVMVLKESKAAYGLKFILPDKYPAHKIPLGLMLKDLFTPRCGVSGKLRALYLAVTHPKRLLYRYWPRRTA
jgi:hypothetical protein